MKKLLWIAGGIVVLFFVAAFIDGVFIRH